ncbi:hypothetical protein M5M_12945 [Simiduia agarivorans SA1 = DSM 21679]|uniref:TIGR02444 family protein n=2 Tax=Simiduia TaxID=447467 RepID=K4KKS7_SIMAS|nr:hypothetical protein M5M_12945 [Simiduia agarivorans SA1 = DSM 21679]
MKAGVLALYRAPGVEPGLLQLQDAHGVSIPLLLWAGWLGTRSVTLAQLPEAELRHLLGWEKQTVGPLRSLRRRLKAELEDQPSLAALREQIKACEQQAEWWLLQQLAALPLETGELCPLTLCLRFAGIDECEPIGALRAAIGARLNSQQQVS